MAELPDVLKVVAPSLQEQALWKLWTCWEEATAPAETLLLQPCPWTGRGLALSPGPALLLPASAAGGQQTRWGKSTCRGPVM